MLKIIKYMNTDIQLLIFTTLLLTIKNQHYLELGYSTKCYCCFASKIYYYSSTHLIT
jgi:hypothetical protein